MVQVFLSYSHDDDAHKARVHSLADRLANEKGLRVVLDRDTGPGGPDEGWPAWSERQVREADRVLVACSREYSLRYEGNDGQSDRGKGTVIETRAIQQFLYDSKGINARFRVVLFDPSHELHIPHQLKGYHRFSQWEESSYQELVAWLRLSAQEAEAAAPEGLVWPKPDAAHTLSLADRRPHFDAVRAALSGQSLHRIFLFEGEGASGKTEFLNELSSYADQIKVPWTRFDFKGAPPIQEFFSTAVLDLGESRLRDTKDAKFPSPLSELVGDLKRLTTPVLFIFDTFEKASEESQSFLEIKFLSRVRTLPAVIVIVGGRKVPDRSQQPWKTLADARTLEPIKSAEDWREYLDRVHNGKLELHQIQTLTLATQGRPGNMRPLLETLLSNATPTKPGGGE
jgi:hypothetical protein